MFDNEIQITIGEIKTLEDKDKAALLEYCKAAFEDDSIKYTKSSRKSITLKKENGLQYKLIVERERKKKSKSMEENVAELGLSDEAARKIKSAYASRDIKKYHLHDIKYLADLLQLLEPANQKKAIDLIINNRSSIYTVNKEDVMVLVLDEGHISAYNVEVWFGGLARVLEKLKIKLNVTSEIVSLVDPAYKKRLKKIITSTNSDLTDFGRRL